MKCSGPPTSRNKVHTATQEKNLKGPHGDQNHGALCYFNIVYEIISSVCWWKSHSSELSTLSPDLFIFISEVRLISMSSQLIVREKRDTSCHYYRRKNRVVDHPSLSFCSFLSITVCIQNQCETETPHCPSSAWLRGQAVNPTPCLPGGGSHLACTLDPVWMCAHSFSPWVVSYLWLAQKSPHPLDDRDKHFATFVGS